jgi:hypothetical protein
MKRTEAETKHYQTFEDLEVYQVARQFRKAMYRVRASGGSPRVREAAADDDIEEVFPDRFNPSSFQRFDE